MTPFKSNFLTRSEKLTGCCNGVWIFTMHITPSTTAIFDQKLDLKLTRRNAVSPGSGKILEANLRKEI